MAGTFAKDWGTWGKHGQEAEKFKKDTTRDSVTQPCGTSFDKITGLTKRPMSCDG
jgi:hypothetical protein